MGCQRNGRNGSNEYSSHFLPALMIAVRAEYQPADDMCPRSVTLPFEVDPNPDGTIKDKGCGEKKDDKTFGAPVLVDVVVRP